MSHQKTAKYVVVVNRSWVYSFAQTIEDARLLQSAARDRGYLDARIQTASEWRELNKGDAA